MFSWTDASVNRCLALTWLLQSTRKDFLYLALSFNQKIPTVNRWKMVTARNENFEGPDCGIAVVKLSPSGVSISFGHQFKSWQLSSNPAPHCYAWDKAWKMIQVFRPLLPHGKPRRSSRLLVSAWSALVVATIWLVNQQKENIPPCLSFLSL